MIIADHLVDPKSESKNIFKACEESNQVKLPTIEDDRSQDSQVEAEDQDELDDIEDTSNQDFEEDSQTLTATQAKHFEGAIGQNQAKSHKLQIEKLKMQQSMHQNHREKTPQDCQQHFSALGPLGRRVVKNNVIGSYRIEKTLGQGTFGKVKQGVHLHTKQKVAIKILEKDKIKDVNDVERVTREIHILKIVRHPNIIQLYEIIETPSRLFLIMEHCCNGELFSYITSKNRLKEEEACRIFQQLISGIEYIGELGIAHRDIKPENLLLDEQKNLKIVDFGLSNTYKQGEKLSTACGSPCYAAPELIKGHEYVGQKADLWSAGVVLFACACGHLPFEDQNTQSLYQKILKADYKFTCYLSKDLINLIQHILVPDPDLRFGLKQILQNSWFKNTYNHPEKKAKGIRVGIDEVSVYQKLVREMSESIKIDKKYAVQCIQANRHNHITSYYYLLLKKKLIEGESLEDGEETQRRNNFETIIPGKGQVRAAQSIGAPPRSGINHSRAKQPLRKMAEGLETFQLMNQKVNILNDLNMINSQAGPDQSSLNPNMINLNNQQLIQQQQLQYQQQQAQLASQQQHMTQGHYLSKNQRNSQQKSNSPDLHHNGKKGLKAQQIASHQRNNSGQKYNSVGGGQQYESKHNRGYSHHNNYALRNQQNIMAALIPQSKNGQNLNKIQSKIPPILDIVPTLQNLSNGNNDYVSGNQSKASIKQQRSGNSKTGHRQKKSNQSISPERAEMLLMSSQGRQNHLNIGSSIPMDDDKIVDMLLKDQEQSLILHQTQLIQGTKNQNKKPTSSFQSHNQKVSSKFRVMPQSMKATTNIPHNPINQQHQASNSNQNKRLTTSSSHTNNTIAHPSKGHSQHRSRQMTISITKEEMQKYNHHAHRKQHSIQINSGNMMSTNLAKSIANGGGSATRGTKHQNVKRAPNQQTLNQTAGGLFFDNNSVPNIMEQSKNSMQYLQNVQVTQSQSKQGTVSKKNSSQNGPIAKKEENFRTLLSQEQRRQKNQLQQIFDESKNHMQSFLNNKNANTTQSQNTAPQSLVVSSTTNNHQIQNSQLQHQQKNHQFNNHTSFMMSKKQKNHIQQATALSRDFGMPLDQKSNQQVKQHDSGLNTRQHKNLQQHHTNNRITPVKNSRNQVAISFKRKNHPQLKLQQSLASTTNKQNNPYIKEVKNLTMKKGAQSVTANAHATNTHHRPQTLMGNYELMDTLVPCQQQMFMDSTATNLPISHAGVNANMGIAASNVVGTVQLNKYNSQNMCATTLMQTQQSFNTENFGGSAHQHQNNLQQALKQINGSKSFGKQQSNQSRFNQTTSLGGNRHSSKKHISTAADHHVKNACSVSQSSKNGPGSIISTSGYTTQKQGNQQGSKKQFSFGQHASAADQKQCQQYPHSVKKHKVLGTLAGPQQHSTQGGLHSEQEHSLQCSLLPENRTTNFMLQYQANGDIKQAIRIKRAQKQPPGAAVQSRM